MREQTETRTSGGLLEALRAADASDNTPSKVLREMRLLLHSSGSDDWRRINDVIRQYQSGTPMSKQSETSRDCMGILRAIVQRTSSGV
jgi:hypothetical protein